MLRMYNLASSSSGNCTLICSDNTKLLIDVGMSMKALSLSLESLGLSPEDIDGIVLTHEHSDHIKGLGAVSRKYGLPIYATDGTIYEVIIRASTGIIADALFHTINTRDYFEIKDIRIQPVKISHDAAEPIAVRMFSENKSLAVVTDLGCFDNYIIDSLQGLNAVLLESNHDVNMLQAGSYPFELKKRILSDYGHLSNTAAAELLKNIWHKDLRKVVLGHLSKENNMPALALKNMENAMFLDGAAGKKLLDIRVAPVSELLETVVI